MKAELTPAVAYIRMSSGKQEASPEQQRAEVAKLAKRLGYKIIREYFDSGISGDNTPKRVEFQRMIADAETKRDFCAILCWDQDRFGRFDSIEAGRWIYPLRQAGVWLATVAQGVVDWNSFTSRVMYSIQQEGKYQYLVDLSRNVLRGRIASATRGRLIVTPPYGYDRAFYDAAGDLVKRVPARQKFNRPKGWTVKLIPAERLEEIETVRWLFDRFANTDCSIRWLVVELNRRGVRTRRGAIWNPTAVQYILRSRVYLGELTFGRQRCGKYHQVSESGTDPDRPNGKGDREPPIVVKGCHEPLVSLEEFEAVQTKLAQRSSGKAKPRAAGYLLTGVARCGHCGRPLCGHGGRGRGHTYYACPGAKVGICQRRNVRREWLDDYVLDVVHQRVFNPEAVDQIIGAIHRQAKAAPSFAEQVKDRRDKLAAMERKIAKGTENLLLADAENVPELQKLLNGWRREGDRLQSEVERLAADASGANVDERVKRAELALDKLRGLLASHDPLEVRAVVKGLIEEILIWWVPRGERYHKVDKGRITLKPFDRLLESSSSIAFDHRHLESAALSRRPTTPRRRERRR